MFMIVLLPQQSMSVIDEFFWDSSEKLLYWQGAVIEYFLLYLNCQIKIPFHSLVLQEQMKMNVLGSIEKKEKKLGTGELGGLAVAAGVRSHAFIGW